MALHQRSRGIGLIALVALAGVAVLGGLISILPKTESRCPEPSARIVLDPGHGGEDPGAINDAAGIIEREFVLDVARRAELFLEDAGYSVALTRNDAQTGYANTPRGVIANLCHAFAYVSIHLNSFGEPEPNYAKTFWGIEEKDAAFAEIMQVALVTELQPGTDLGDSGLEQLENGGLLTARMPAILVEPVFLSNPEEATRLTASDGERLDAIAHAIADGVDVWLRVHHSGPIDLERPWLIMTAQDRVLGPPRGAPAQALGGALRAGAERRDQLWAYMMEVYRLAPQVGIDPAVVVAQSALESGWWQSPAWVEHLNPAGIGVTSDEVTSPSWQSGVDAARAHLVHLYLYAVGAIAPDHPLAPYVALDPRYKAALDAGRAGIASSMGDMAGRWAMDPNYGEAIARVGSRLFSQ